MRGENANEKRSQRSPVESTRTDCNDEGRRHCSLESTQSTRPSCDDDGLLHRLVSREEWRGEEWSGVKKEIIRSLSSAAARGEEEEWMRECDV